MKKKYILTMIIILQVCMILFVVSYSWFNGDYYNKTVTGNDIEISTTEDLILTYKNVTYSSLRLNDVLDTSFIFEQVSSTGLGDDKFYKIDYSPNLQSKPAQYVEATANVDYIELECTLSSASKAKRVYLDGVNSGFFVGETTGTYISLADDLKYAAANCMRMSISYVDQDSNQRYLVLSNNAYKNYVILDDDIVTKDTTTNKNPTYRSGVRQYLYNFAEDYTATTTGGSVSYTATTATGIENTTVFENFDINTNNENMILFDLQPYQVKALKICIWLDGTACEKIGGVDYISGRSITCSLRFSSSTNIGVEYSTKVVESGMKINTINDLLAKSNKMTYTSSANCFSIAYSNSYYQMKSDKIEKSGDNYVIKESGVVKTTYVPVTVDQDTYYTDYNNTSAKLRADAKTAGINVDPLYYNLVRNTAYVRYDELSWKLNDATSTSIKDSSTLTLGTIDSNNKVIIGTGDENDQFSLIGYVSLYSNDTDATNDVIIPVVVETYVFGHKINVIEHSPVAITKTTNTNNQYEAIEITDYVESGDTFYVIQSDGEKDYVYYSNSENAKSNYEFIWVVESCTLSNTSLSINNFTNTTATTICGKTYYVVYYETKTNGTDSYKKFDNLLVEYNQVSTDDTFYLVGYCATKDNSGNITKMEEAVKVLYYVNKTN